MARTRNNWGALREPRIGIMLHYDGSVRDDWALQWLRYHPDCRVSYNWLVLDDGRVEMVTPTTARAWHAGVCRTSDPVRLPYRDANSAFYGVSIAAGAMDTATLAQKMAVAELCAKLFDEHGWSRVEGLHRIVGHNTEAWPRGRKVDPEGPNLAAPVLSVAEVRRLVAVAGSSR
jgi:N-acetyl-anhydromuramyl-L-alanine amidase AmpD